MKSIFLISIIAVMVLMLGACRPSGVSQTTVMSDAAIASAGWDSDRLNEAFALARRYGTTTLIVMTHGTYVKTMGDLRERHRVHSVRKALLSALVGQHVGTGAGKIDLNRTLASLGIDDHPYPLTYLQRQATVLHLIKSISGINHGAAGEIGTMTSGKDRLLGFEPNLPGTKWAYNNWDYNALTTIFEQETGYTVYDAFVVGLARPLGMQDITRRSVFYVKDDRLSRHAKAGFWMSARDLARFGQLYLNTGRWQGRQVIPAAWIDRVTTDFSRTDRSGLTSGHGYLWWIPCDRESEAMGVPKGTFMASGFAGQRIVVIPAWDTVIVHTVSTDDYSGYCTEWAEQRGLSRQQVMRYSLNDCRESGNRQEEFCRKCRYYRGSDFSRLLAEIIAARSE